MSNSIWRFKLMETENDKTPIKWVDCDKYDDLTQISLIVEGKKTLDSHLEICAVGNHIKFVSEPDNYIINKVITQNGASETTIDITCIKL